MSTDDFETAFQQLCKEHALAVEDLTQKQFAEAIWQAIQSGDFKRLVVSGGGQQVVYIPYADVQRLRNRIADLQKQIEELESRPQLNTCPN